jgi:hypothetical protein
MVLPRLFLNIMVCSSLSIDYTITSNTLFFLSLFTFPTHPSTHHPLLFLVNHILMPVYSNPFVALLSLI